MSQNNDRTRPIYVRFESETRVTGDIPPNIDKHDPEEMARHRFYQLDKGAYPPYPPSPRHHYEARFAEGERRVTMTWVEVADNPRSFSKRKLYRALETADVWSQVEAYMESAGVLKDWEYATTLDEDDPLLVAAVNALKTQLGLTDEQVEAILAASVAEGI